MVEPRAVCSSCGRAAITAEDQARAQATWSRSFDRGRESWTCVQCLRANVRSIEAKLDQEWW